MGPTAAIAGYVIWGEEEFFFNLWWSSSCVQEMDWKRRKSSEVTPYKLAADAVSCYFISVGQHMINHL